MLLNRAAMFKHTNLNPRFSLLFAPFALLAACSSGGTTSGSGPNGPSEDPTQNVDSSGAELCVDSINAYRASLGLPPYARWTDAEVCSNEEAQSDSNSGKAHGAFNKCGEFAQNECPGWPGPHDKMIKGCLKMMWEEGPGGGHYDSMSSTKYKKVACGYYTETDGSIWAVQNFK